MSRTITPTLSMIETPAVGAVDGRVGHVVQILSHGPVQDLVLVGTKRKKNGKYRNEKRAKRADERGAPADIPRFGGGISLYSISYIRGQLFAVFASGTSFGSGVCSDHRDHSHNVSRRARTAFQQTFLRLHQNHSLAATANACTSS